MYHFGIYIDPYYYKQYAFLAIVMTIILIYFAYFIVGNYLANKYHYQWKPSVSGLLVFLIIIFYVAVTALPNFHTGNAKPKQLEARTNLHAIYAAQRSYFSNANTYAGGPEAFKLMNWEPSGQNRYAYFCGEQEIGNKLPGPPNTVYSLQQIDPEVSIRPASSKSGFTCMAVGNIDNDTDLDVWVINDAKILTNPANDI